MATPEKYILTKLGQRRLAMKSPLHIALSTLPLYGGAALASDLQYEWTRNLLSSWDNGAGDVIFDTTTGNVVAVGWFTHSINFHPNGGNDPRSSASFRDAYIWKMDGNHSYDAGGWSTTLGFGINEGFSSVRLDAQGDVYVAGGLDGSPWTRSQSAIRRYSATGQPLWSYMLGGSGANSASSVALGEDGSVYIAGGFQGSVNFNAAGNETRAAKGDWDAYLLKLSASGQFQWVVTYGGTGSDWMSAVDVQGDMVYMGGHFSNTIDFSGQHVSSGAQDVLVAQLNTSGQVQWVNTVQGAGNAGISALRVGSNGHMVVVGGFDGNITDPPLTSNGNWDGYVMGLNTAGAVRWAHAFGGASDDNANKVVLRPNGDAFISGYYRSTAHFPGIPQPLVAAGAHDALVVKLDDDGNYLWHHTIGSSSGSVNVSAITFDPAKKDMYLVGSFNGTIDFNPFAAQDMRTDPAVDWSMFISKYSNAPVDLIETRALMVTKAGNGTVSSLPAGIQCGDDCTESLALGTSITLAAQADEGYRFTGWGGACSGTRTCVVTIDMEKSVTAEFVSTAVDQTIGDIIFNPQHLVVGGVTKISAKATSRLPITFNVTTPTVCALNGTTLSGLLEGVCTVTADQAGNIGFRPAAQRVQSLNVFQPPQAGGTMTLDLSVYACASNPVVTTQTPTICTVGSVNGNIATIQLNTAGSCRVDVICNTFNGTEVHVQPKVPLISRIIPSPMPTLPEQSDIGTLIDIPAQPEGLCASARVTSRSLTPTVCSVNRTQVTLKTPGTCRVAVDRAATPSCSAAHDELIIEAMRANQTINGITFTAATLYAGEKATLKATSTSGLLVTLSSTTPNVCAVNKNMLTSIAAGECVIAANQAGDTRYFAAPQITQSISILEPKADIVVMNILLKPAMPTARATFTASITVKNIGKKSSSPSYLETWVDEPTPQGCGAQGDAWADMRSIAPGATKTFNLTLRSGAAGIKSLRVFADSWCETVEFDEENNQSTVSYTVQ